MKMRLNARLIENPKKAREVLMMIAVALYTGINKNTPMSEAAEVAGICASMWHVCDVLADMAGGERE